MSISHFVSEVEKLAHQFFGKDLGGDAALNDIELAVSAGLQYLKTNVPAVVIGLAETVLAGAATGTPWGTLIATLIGAAEAKGVTLLEQSAGVALNFAQSNLIATNTATGAAVNV